MSTSSNDIHHYYTQSGPMTSAGRHHADLAHAPPAVVDLVRISQGLLLHEHVAPMYGVTLSDQRRADVHLRKLADMLDALARDGHPPLAARPLDQRLVGNCRDYTLMSVALLRARGVPARARCGFAAYFSPPHFVDHWVCEYWSADASRWVLVDAQLDDVQRGGFRIGFDTLDVPSKQFAVAGEAWELCRSGAADPSRFGILDMNGLWFVAGNVLRDVAALNNVEMLPWDVWGPMPTADAGLGAETLALFDALAALSRDPDANFDELRRRYRDTPGLRVPARVHNAVLDRQEPSGVPPAPDDIATP